MSSPNEDIPLFLYGLVQRTHSTNEDTKITIFFLHNNAAVVLNSAIPATQFLRLTFFLNLN